MAEIPDNPQILRPDSRWQILAGLRFLLAMVVVASHQIWFKKPDEAPPMLEMLGGTSAVLGFLIVSGYSIGHSLQRRPRGFFKRRLMRIYPLYVCAVLFSLLPFLSFADALPTPDASIVIPKPHWWVVIGNLLMLQNIICPALDSNTLVWTLGIEVICYCLAPLFARTPLVLLVLLIGISSAAFGWLYPRMYAEHQQHYVKLMWGLPLLMFAWAWLGGFVLHRLGNSLFVGLPLAGLCFAMLWLNTTYAAKYSIACLVGSAIVVTFAPRIRLPRRIGPVLNYLGDLSYPVYLFHLPTFLLGYCIMSVNNMYALMVMALAVSAGFLFIESFAKPIITRSWNRDAVPTAG
jgi:peptidoglycan/LPS O-acetylase OafA/YrhL